MQSLMLQLLNRRIALFFNQQHSLSLKTSPNLLRARLRVNMTNSPRQDTRVKALPLKTFRQRRPLQLASRKISWLQLTGQKKPIEKKMTTQAGEAPQLFKLFDSPSEASDEVDTECSNMVQPYHPNMALIQDDFVKNGIVYTVYTY